MVCKFGYRENQEKCLLTSIFISFRSPNKLWCLLHTKSVVLSCCHYKNHTGITIHGIGHKKSEKNICGL
jgi:hypothetical protein